MVRRSPDLPDRRRRRCDRNRCVLTFQNKCPKMLSRVVCHISIVCKRSLRSFTETISGMTGTISFSVLLGISMRKTNFRTTSDLVGFKLRNWPDQSHRLIIYHVRSQQRPHGYASYLRLCCDQRNEPKFLNALALINTVIYVLSL